MKAVFSSPSVSKLHVISNTSLQSSLDICAGSEHNVDCLENNWITILYIAHILYTVNFCMFLGQAFVHSYTQLYSSFNFFILFLHFIIFVSILYLKCVIPIIFHSSGLSHPVSSYAKVNTTIRDAPIWYTGPVSVLILTLLSGSGKCSFFVNVHYKMQFSLLVRLIQADWDTEVVCGATLIPGLIKPYINRILISSAQGCIQI